MLSATLIIPALKNMSVQYVWSIFAVLSIIGSFVLFRLLKYQSTQAVQVTTQAPQNFKHSPLGLVIIIAYMCSAFAYIPHSLFWMDYLSGTLHFPLQQQKFILDSLWDRKLYWRLCGLLFKPLYWLFTSHKMAIRCLLLGSCFTILFPCYCFTRLIVLSYRSTYTSHCIY